MAAEDLKKYYRKSIDGYYDKQKKKRQQQSNKFSRENYKNTPEYKAWKAKKEQEKKQRGQGYSGWNKIDEHGNVQEHSRKLPERAKENSFLEDFDLGAKRNIASYLSSGAKALGYDDYHDDMEWQKRKYNADIDSEGAAITGEFVADPANFLPGFIVSKGQKFGKIGNALTKTKKRAVATSAGLGAGLGYGISKAQNYGDTTMSEDEKQQMDILSAGIVSILNGTISAFTKGRVNDVIPKDWSQATPTDVERVEKIAKNPEAFGLDSTQGNALKKQVTEVKDRFKVDPRFAREETGRQMQPEQPNFTRPNSYPVPNEQIEPTVDPAPTPTRRDPYTGDIIDAEVTNRNAHRNAGAGRKDIIDPQREQHTNFTRPNSYPVRAKVDREAMQRDLERLKGSKQKQTVKPDYEDMRQKMGAKTQEEMFERLRQHPRYNEAVDNARDRYAKDMQHPYRRIKNRSVRHENHGNGYETQIDREIDVENPDYDFSMSKNDVKKIESGKFDDETLRRLEDDLGVLDNHPGWAEPANNKKPAGMTDEDWAEAQGVFAKGGDHLAAGAISGVEQDEEGNYSLDLEKFILGLGGYAAAKKLLTHPKATRAVKEIVRHGLDKFEQSSYNLNQYMAPVKSKAQKEKRGIYNVTFNGKNATEVRKADGDELIKYAKGNKNQGAIHIQKHLGDGSTGEVSKEELLNIGDVIREGKLYENYGKNVYELEKDGVRFRVITGKGKNDNEKIITFYSNRNLEERKGYEISLITNNRSLDKSIANQSGKSQDGMRGGFIDVPKPKNPWSDKTLKDLAMKDKEFTDIAKQSGVLGNIRSAIKKNFTDTFSTKYHDARDDIHNTIQKKSIQFERLAKELDKLPDDTDEMLYRYLTGEDVKLPKNMKKFADDIRYTIDSMGKKAVDKGILSEEAYKDWVGQYLHRTYELKLNAKGIFNKGFKVDRVYERGKSFQSSDVNEIKGWLEKQGYLDPQEMMASSIDEVSKILDNKGMLGSVGEGKISIKQQPNGKYKIRRDFTPDERKQMGELKKASYAVPETLFKLERMLQHARFLEDIKGIDDVVMSDDLAKKLDYQEIQDEGFVKLEGRKYGALSGKYVRQDVADDIGAMHRELIGSEKEAVNAWLKYLSMVKKSKTVWNPTAHFNNFTGNLFLMHLAGQNTADIAKAVGRGYKLMRQYGRLERLEQKKLIQGLEPSEQRIYNELKENTKIVQEARNAGIFGRSQLNDILKGVVNKENKPTNFLGRADRYTEKAYQLEDDFNRLSYYLTLRDKGESPEAARRMINLMLPDYTKPLPKGWRLMRDTGVVPFISWNYYTMPSIVRMLKTKTGAKQAAKVIGGLSLMEYMATDGEVTPVDNLPFVNSKNKPDFFKGRRFAYNKTGDRVDTVKMDRIVPYAELQNPFNFATSQISGPVSAVASLKNIDLYSGRPIAYESKDVSDQAVDVAKHTVGNYAPVPIPAMTLTDMADKAMRSEDSYRRASDIVPRDPWQEFVKLFPGLNTLSYNKDNVK